MNRETKTRSSWILFPVMLLLASVGVQVTAQTLTPQDSSAPATTQTQANQAGPLADLAPLNLSADQIKKIRGIYAELKEQRQAANQKLRQSQRALSEAVESPTPDESLIGQRSHELAEAQANAIRLRSLAESRILQVLTPEQRIRLREMRQRNQALRREGNQPQLPGNVLRRRQQGLQRNPNSPPLRSTQRRPAGTAPKP